MPTERADVILPRLREVVFRFGPPCAIMRDLGRAMAEASQSLVKETNLSIPVLACHLHFLKDIGKDLLQDSHDKLRGLFRQTGLRGQLRTFARELGRGLGGEIEEARAVLLQWQTETAQGRRIPAGSAGIAVVRGMAQWILDYPSEGNGRGFPFDLPWLGLYHRCLQTSSAIGAFLEKPPNDPKVRKALDRLRRILRPVERNTHAFGPIAESLTARAKLFDELRHALRLTDKRQHVDAARALAELKDVRSEVQSLTRALGARVESALRQRRSSSRSGKDMRAAIDIILTHIQSHGGFLWGHAIRLPKKLGGGLRLVDRTNNVLESYFHALKHGERRRSGRKILTQDFECLPPAAALATNLNHTNYVSILCGSLDRLPEAFAKLDAQSRQNFSSTTVISPFRIDAETASLNTTDRRIVRRKEMTERVIEAAKSGLRKKRVA